MVLRRTHRLPLEELAPFLFKPPEALGPCDWSAVFGADHPLEVEIGFGKGLFLVNAAKSRPDVNFLGIEIARKYQLFAATRLAKRQLHNVRLVKADARVFLRDFVAPATFQAVHVYFPDPWWKRRHLKRRVFASDFAAQCERILRPGGHLHITTDVQKYFEVIKHLMEIHTRLQPLPPGEPNDEQPGPDFLTNFERKFRAEGRPIYRISYERKAQPDLRIDGALGSDV